MAGPRRILITGASGFVGRHLTPMLQAAFPDASQHPCTFDVTDAAATNRAVCDIAPDACIHLAGIAAISAARRDPDRAWQVNLHGTLNLARAVLHHASGCHFLFVSSADIYGRSFSGGEPAAETTLVAPMNDYGATKAAADLAIGALVGDGLHAIRLRPFNHTGPGQSPDFVVAAFARQVARIAAGIQAPVLRTGDLEPIRDFLDVRDVCAAYTACLARAEALPAGAILNIASGGPRRIGDILEELLVLSKVAVRIESETNRLRPLDIVRASGDSALARRLLGWKPEIPWRRTLSDVLDYWRERVISDPSA